MIKVTDLPREAIGKADGVCCLQTSPMTNRMMRKLKMVVYYGLKGVMDEGARRGW